MNNAIDIKNCTMPSFSVIGKEGSTNDGSDFIKKLWNDANQNFNQVVELAEKEPDGNLLGIWGLMSNFDRNFKPWEDNFTKGLYLAGVQVKEDALPPTDWVKWTVPSFEYLYVKVEKDYQETFHGATKYMKENNLNLAGAVFDYNCPSEKGQAYIFLPIKRL